MKSLSQDSALKSRRWSSYFWGHENCRGKVEGGNLQGGGGHWVGGRIGTTGAVLGWACFQSYFGTTSPNTFRLIRGL